MRAGTTPACTHQLALSHWRNSVKNTHLTCTDPPKREGRAGSQNLERIASTTNPQRSAQNASMRCNVSHKKSKGPWSHPTDHVRLRRRPLTALAGNLTLPKLHLATLIYEKTKDKFPWEHPMTFTVDKKHTNQRGLKGKGVETGILNIAASNWHLLVQYPLLQRLLQFKKQLYKTKQTNLLSSSSCVCNSDFSFCVDSIRLWSLSMSLFFSWRACVNKWISYLTIHDNQNLRKPTLICILL